MICYVMFGGMVATTWVQIVKATLLLAAGVAIALLILARFGFDYDSLIAQAIACIRTRGHDDAPGLFGQRVAVDLPWHDPDARGGRPAACPDALLHRPDTRAARVSVFWAVMCQSGFFALIFVIGFGALAIIGGDPLSRRQGRHPRRGNMATVHLSHALGGDTLMGLVSAVAFATILAVVAGLTLTGASAVRTISTPASSAGAGQRSAARSAPRGSPRSGSASSRYCSASPSRPRTSPT